MPYSNPSRPLKQPPIKSHWGGWRVAAGGGVGNKVITSIQMLCKYKQSRKQLHLGAELAERISGVLAAGPGEAAKEEKEAEE